ncbi:MAG: hypothetical protein LQ342_005070 [Letrouitia transgressa]|nr:MAG: hypothetical protein LQ342_005070 [Letrouitia transgressa]
MSVEIDWQGLTTGPEGLALAGSVKDFIHDKFQQVQLPHFIRSVSVHAFDFGKECPVVNLKDICDPLPEFYEDQDVEGDEDGAFDEQVGSDSVQHDGNSRFNGESYSKVDNEAKIHDSTFRVPNRPNHIDTRLPFARPGPNYAEHIASPFLSRSSTPGIPGGTSNLSYFHLPLSAGLSGAQTPLAAVAGRNPFSAASSEQHLPTTTRSNQYPYARHDLRVPPRPFADPSSRPSTSDSYAQSPPSSEQPEYFDNEPNKKRLEPDPSDVQIVLHISYSGSVSLSITAEILLDYPMTSFVGIPLKLNITGLSFDGVAIVAYLRKRAHFAFLGPEDARTLVGGESRGDDGEGSGVSEAVTNLGGLLREIQVESEIGKKDGGKQVLKNVGKVEKFVLEQVRRIFEEEFVWPSFWTFLV